MKDVYTYPAILDYAPDGISIFFPDFPGCMSCADNDEEAAFMAEDALTGWLDIAEDEGQTIPNPTPMSSLRETLKPNQSATLVRVDMKRVRIAKSNRNINKMCTVPAWLVQEADEAGINYSRTLQDALMDKLGIKHTPSRKRRK